MIYLNFLIIYYENFWIKLLYYKRMYRRKTLQNNIFFIIFKFIELIILSYILQKVKL